MWGRLQSPGCYSGERRNFLGGGKTMGCPALRRICRSSADDPALVSSVSSTCRWHGRISGARSDSGRPSWRKERSTLACLSSGDELIYPIRTG